MKEILMYVLGVVVCSGVFTAFYRAVMYQRTSFRTARVFLIASMVVATIIPAFDIPVWQSEPIELPAFEFTGTPAASPVAEAQVDIWPVALLCLWGMGVAMLACLMIVQAVKIHRTKRHSEVYASGGCEVAVSAEIESPFSFLQTIYVTSGTPPSEMQQIVLHEASHIRHRHSVEKIFAETLKTLLWFNPFAWITARLLNEVQEFEADRDVLLGGCTVEEYLPVIFKQVFGYAPEISTALGNSLTKKRFEMMTKKFKHNRHSWLRTVGAVPLVAAMMMLFGFTHRAPEIITPEPKITETTTVTAGGDGVVVSGLPVDIITISHKEGEPDVTHKLDDRLIYWLRNENREITADEMKAINPSDIQTVSVLKEKSIFPAEVRSAMGDRNIDGAVLIELKTSEVGKDAPIYIADEMPKFEGGGLSDFRNWLMNRIVYPKDAVDKNIQGKVTLKFVVEEDGSVSNIEVLSSPDQLLSDEAVRVMKLSPKWTPGKQDGKPARIYYILPVDFALSGK